VKTECGYGAEAKIMGFRNTNQKATISAQFPSSRPLVQNGRIGYALMNSENLVAPMYG